MSPISRSLPLENIKEGTPAAKETKYNLQKPFTKQTLSENVRLEPESDLH